MINDFVSSSGGYRVYCILPDGRVVKPAKQRKEPALKRWQPDL